MWHRRSRILHSKVAEAPDRSGEPLRHPKSTATKQTFVARWLGVEFPEPADIGAGIVGKMADQIPKIPEERIDVCVVPAAADHLGG